MTFMGNAIALGVLLTFGFHFWGDLSWIMATYAGMLTDIIVLVSFVLLLFVR